MTPDLIEGVSPEFVVTSTRGGRVADVASTVPTPGVRLVTQKRLAVAILAASDALVLFLAFATAFWIRFDLQWTVAPEVVPHPDYYRSLTVVLVPLWIGLFALAGLYDPLAKRGGFVESGRTFQASTVATMLVIVGTFLMPEFVISRAWLVCVWVLSFSCVATSRLLAGRVVRACRKKGYLLAPALIVGTNEEARSLAAFLADVERSGVRTLGFLATARHTPAHRDDSLPVLGTTRDIAPLVREHGISDLIVAITALSREELLALCEGIDTLPVQLRLSSGLYELLTARVSVHTLGHVPLLTLHKSRLDRGEAAVKLALECAIATLALVALSPVLLAIAVAIRCESRGPVLYRRRVLGASGRQFDAFKFRTMQVNGAELLARHEGALEQLRAEHKLKADPRVTGVGRWLRRYSLDELPQLFNVLLGQMALVGPRMISPAEAEKYGRQRIALFTVKPGITGLWQVSGRSDLSYEERVRIDMFYVRNYSIWLDLQILAQTLPAILKGHGAY